jgi:hypothetical protein
VSAHLLRPKPPWRDGYEVTACGKDAAGLAAYPLEEFARLWTYGRVRTCQGCSAPLIFYSLALPVWEKDPAAVIGQDCDPSDRAARHERACAEFRALAALAAAHEEEFAGLLELELAWKALGGGG